MEILNSCTDCDEIQFMEDGSWCPMKPKKENQEVCQTAAFSGIEGTGAVVTQLFLFFGRLFFFFFAKATFTLPIFTFTKQHSERFGSHLGAGFWDHTETPGA